MSNEYAPHLVTIYFPQVLDSLPYPSAPDRTALEEIRLDIATVSDGYTATQGVGHWHDITEPVTIFTVVVDSRDKAEILSQRARMTLEAVQESALVTVQVLQ